MCAVSRRDAKWEEIKKYKSSKRNNNKTKQLRHFPHLDLDQVFFFPSLLLVQLLSNVRLIALNKYMTNPVQIIIPPPKNKINPNGDDDREITRV